MVDEDVLTRTLQLTFIIWVLFNITGGWMYLLAGFILFWIIAWNAGF